MKEIAFTSFPPITLPSTATTSLPSRPQGDNFLTYLKQAVGEVDDLHQTAEKDIQQLVGGGTGDLQETLIAMERADISFRLMMQVRNKILDAYQEVMRMQV
ncbi:MAG: flagellar hook-basal body complex protein FliE [Candidatus Binatia bacterium]